jgi:type I restriction enzyme S subunit
VPLGEVARFIRGITFKPEDVVPVGKEGSVACMRTRNVQVVLDLADVWGIPSAFVKREDQFLMDGDLLVSSANSWNLVGKCCWVPSLPWRATFGGFVSVLRADRKRLDPRFLYHWFSSANVQAIVRSFGQQTTNISNLNFERCLRLEVALPTLPEQQRIAAILDQADALRANRRAALTHLDALAQSIFLDMFGDPATNPMGWPVRTFDETMRDETSLSSKLLQSDFLDAGHYPVVDQGQSSIAGYCNDPGYLCRSELPAVVFGDHTRIVKLVRQPFVVGADGAKVLVPQPGLTAEYLSWLLRLSAIPSLGYSRHMREVRRLRFPTPPLAKQEQFAGSMAGIEKQRHVLESANRECDDLFLSLQHRAFRGDL